MKLPEKLLNLSRLLKEFPGVGDKTAMRYILSIIGKGDERIKELSMAISDLTRLKQCSECGMFTGGDDDLCDICLSPYRGQQVICVVETVADCLAIERSGEFSGLYHILGGVLNPLAGIGPDDLTIDKLLLRIKSRSIKELILALNPSVEGDVTCSYLKDLVEKDVKVGRLAQGIPVGGNLEYLDSPTINKALENRKLI